MQKVCKCGITSSEAILNRMKTVFVGSRLNTWLKNISEYDGHISYDMDIKDGVLWHLQTT